MPHVPPSPGSRRARRGRGARRLALAALLGAVSCLCPPSNEALLDVGFRSPEQTVRTFQTGVRADEPTLEYRCLSQGFVRANGLSQLAYREFREQLFRQHAFLRTGLAKAEVEAVTPAPGDPTRCRVALRSFGRRFVLELALEDFAQVWTGDTLALDREAPFEAWTDVQVAGEERWFTGGAPLPAGVDGRAVTELRLGREWKIDGFPGETEGDAALAESSP